MPHPPCWSLASTAWSPRVPNPALTLGRSQWLLEHATVQELIMRRFKGQESPHARKAPTRCVRSREPTAGQGHAQNLSVSTLLQITALPTNLNLVFLTSLATSSKEVLMFLGWP